MIVKRPQVPSAGIQTDKHFKSNFKSFRHVHVLTKCRKQKRRSIHIQFQVFLVASSWSAGILRIIRLCVTSAARLRRRAKNLHHGRMQKVGGRRRQSKQNRHFQRTTCSTALTHCLWKQSKQFELFYTQKVGSRNSVISTYLNNSWADFYVSLIRLCIIQSSVGDKRRPGITMLHRLELVFTRVKH